jgi:hypothetical protein
MCDCALLSEIRKRARFHEEQAETFQRMQLVYDEAVCDEDDSEECSETYTTEESESEPQTVEEHVWAVATTDGGTVEDVIKNSALYQAVVENGYCQSKTKFTRDTCFLREHPKIGVVYHGRQPEMALRIALQRRMGVCRCPPRRRTWRILSTTTHTQHPRKKGSDPAL